MATMLLEIFCITDFFIKINTRDILLVMRLLSWHPNPFSAGTVFMYKDGPRIKRTINSL